VNKAKPAAVRPGGCSGRRMPALDLEEGVAAVAGRADLAAAAPAGTSKAVGKMTRRGGAISRLAARRGGSL